MITFGMLLIALIVLSIMTAFIVLIGGVEFVLAFGDLIIFGLIVWTLIKLFKRMRK